MTDRLQEVVDIGEEIKAEGKRLSEIAAENVAYAKESHEMALANVRNLWPWRWPRLWSTAWTINKRIKESKRRNADLRERLDANDQRLAANAERLRVALESSNGR